MEKSNIITRIIKKFLSGRFSVETEEKVQRWIMKEENAEEKEKASLEYWNELDTEADSKTYSALERVNLRTGYNKEHLENIVLYHKFVRIVAVVIPICLLAGGLLYYIPSENEQIEISTAYGEQKRLVLPDSSEVWLNAGSTITYPKTFTKENRVVTLVISCFLMCTCVNMCMEGRFDRGFLSQTPLTYLLRHGLSLNLEN